MSELIKPETLDNKEQVNKDQVQDTHARRLELIEKLKHDISREREIESLRTEVASLKEDADIKAKLMLDYQANWESKVADLKEQNASLTKDAERYRWLREYRIDSYLANGKLETLDDAIDAAMLSETGEL